MPTDLDAILAGDVPGATAGWFPVVAIDDLTGPRPVPFTLFGEPYVMWTGADGTVAATSRRCPHRRADLADATVSPGGLACPYHGWTFDGQGTCTLIPQLAPGTPYPRGARLAGLPTEVRWGMAWVWGDPDVGADPFPEWPDAADGFDVFLDAVEDWHASALRVVDNLLDTLHPAFVHVGTFGDPSRADVEADSVEFTPLGLRTTICERSAAEQTSGRDLRITLSELIGPFTVRTRAYTGPDGSPGPDDFALLTVAVPLDDATTRYVRFQAIDPGTPRDRDALRAFSARVLAEDRPVVEHLEQPLPLGPGREIHLRADRPTIMYRRYLAARLTRGA